MGINPVELERRLSILEGNKEQVIKWLTTEPSLTKMQIREKLIELFGLDTGDMSVPEAAKVCVKAFSAFFYAPHLTDTEDYDEISMKLINVLGDHAIHFLRERGTKPQGKRDKYTRIADRNLSTGELVPVLNGSYVEVRTVPAVAEATPVAEDKYLDHYLISEADTSADADYLLEQLLLALKESPDSSELASALKKIYYSAGVDNLEIPAKLVLDLISCQPAKKFLNRLRLNSLLS